MSNKYIVQATEGLEEVILVPVEDDGEGTMTWREAKKALRSYYLNKAASLRSVNEKTYFE